MTNSLSTYKKKKVKNTPAPKIQHAGVLSGQLTGTSNPSIFLPWKEGAGPKQYTEDFLHKMNLWHTLPHRPATSIDSISPASVLRLDPLLEPLLCLSQMSKGDDLKARKDMGTKGKVGTKESTKKKKNQDEARYQFQNKVPHRLAERSRHLSFRSHLLK